ncbi:rubredoxin [Alcaligenes aquatilis]|uniref:rubredoxin n=1 Tax=Alcaligenes aquatilis TaxID=323284 RepID=UPI003609DA3B
MSKITANKVLICLVCGWVYSEAEGDPNSGIAPGTPWDAIPQNWVCPECGVGKNDFTVIEI